MPVTIHKSNNPIYTLDNNEIKNNLPNMNITSEEDLTRLSIDCYKRHFSEEKVDHLLRFANDFYSSNHLSESKMNKFLDENRVFMKQIFGSEIFVEEEVNLIENSFGNPKANFATNFKEIFKNDLKFKNKIKFNSFDSEIYIMNDDNELEMFSENHIFDARLYIEEKYDLSCSNKDAFFQGLKSCAMDNTYNPLKDLITKTKWDGKERIKTLFSDYLGSEDNEYTEMVAIKIMVGAIARILNPGCKFDLMPILYGKQGIGKSYFVRKLASDFVIEDLNKLSSQDKDEIMKIKNGWFVEVSELTALKNVSKENAKSFITQQENNYRELFSNLNCLYKRHNVFIGTTNSIDFLNDASGNRRFLPIECGIHTPSKSIFSKDDDSLESNVQQIYAEALHMYKNGERLYLSSEQDDMANTVREENEKNSPLFEYIYTYLSKKFPKDWNEYDSIYKKEFIKNESNYSLDDLTDLKQVSTQELLDFAIPDEYAKKHNIDSRKIKIVMSKVNGWMYSSTVYENGNRTRGYKKIS